MISLDDSLSDPLVLIHREIPEDVALCLEEKTESVLSVALVLNHVCRGAREGKKSFFFFLPSPVSRRLRHSGGSPAGRCRCSAERAQSEHLSERWTLMTDRTQNMALKSLFLLCLIVDGWNDG